MRKHLVGLGLPVLGILLGVALSATAQIGLDLARVPKGFLSGNDWRGLSKAEQQTYAIGVVDGLDLASAIKPSAHGLYWINPCVAGMSSDQVRAMLKTEIDATPEDWHLLMVHRAMYHALWKACRNKQSGP